MPRSVANREYHSRRFALSGAFAILKSQGAFTRELRDRIRQLESDIDLLSKQKYAKDKTNAIQIQKASGVL